MPFLIKGNKKIELKENQDIANAAEELGVPFSCSSGICGMCAVNIAKGEENLGPLNENEENLGMGGGMRLACQCKIKSGDVEIE